MLIGNRLDLPGFANSVPPSSERRHGLNAMIGIAGKQLVLDRPLDEPPDLPEVVTDRGPAKIRFDELPPNRLEGNRTELRGQLVAVEPLHGLERIADLANLGGRLPVALIVLSSEPPIPRDQLGHGQIGASPRSPQGASIGKPLPDDPVVFDLGLWGLPGAAIEVLTVDGDDGPIAGLVET